MPRCRKHFLLFHLFYFSASKNSGKSTGNVHSDFFCARRHTPRIHCLSKFLQRNRLCHEILVGISLFFVGCCCFFAGVLAGVLAGRSREKHARGPRLSGDEKSRLVLRPRQPCTLTTTMELRRMRFGPSRLLSHCAGSKLSSRKEAAI